MQAKYRASDDFAVIILKVRLAFAVEMLYI
jgi:hypothetical protein